MLRSTLDRVQIYITKLQTPPSCVVCGSAFQTARVRLCMQCGSDSFLQVLVLQNPHQPVTHIQKSAREPSILLSGSSRNISSNFFGFKLQSSGLLFWFLVPVSSETNGTRGAPLVLQCHHNLSEKFIPEQTSIYWQSNSSVLHVFSKGQEEFQHQSESFKNRTAIFHDQLASGNFSLVINPLMLKDDQLSIEVAYIPESRTLCQNTVHVAAPFDMPNIVFNTRDMMAMCATKGGFPEPELSWIVMDHEGHERTLEPPDVQTYLYKEDDGTYRVTSTANISGSQKVTCSVYNPTSKETLSVIKDVITDEGWSLPLGPVLGVLVILAVIIGAGAVIGCRKMKRRDCSGQNLQELSANEPAPLEDSTPDPAAVGVDDVAK
ncbi:T-lymphocyte activation antigen CD80 isoform X1 [Oreochromis niloticus]|uniref:T-lymphocyte activation antigen CD80 isoform X1 n=1 Tax=Oreochromis niloticus TaxID=8128 RepID=UPI000905C6B9|nr:T-lymphocyte activation antigen CD80 isoform X1 [Oreochromis niloticus]XP_019208126.1 T-lymphocyte activation antigen CD80 isoform X1 [Oreochromis niloticus]